MAECLVRGGDDEGMTAGSRAKWTDPGRSVPEALRVLRSGGALAIWWNTTAFDVPWIREQHQRIAHHCGVKPTSRARPDDSDAIRLAGLSGSGSPAAKCGGAVWSPSTCTLPTS